MTPTASIASSPSGGTEGWSARIASDRPGRSRNFLTRRVAQRHPAAATGDIPDFLDRAVGDRPRHHPGASVNSAMLPRAVVQRRRTSEPSGAVASGIAAARLAQNRYRHVAMSNFVHALSRGRTPGQLRSAPIAEMAARTAPATASGRRSRRQHPLPGNSPRTPAATGRALRVYRAICCRVVPLRSKQPRDGLYFTHGKAAERPRRSNETNDIPLCLPTGRAMQKAVRRGDRDGTADGHREARARAAAARA